MTNLLGFRDNELVKEAIGERTNKNLFIIMMRFLLIFVVGSIIGGIFYMINYVTINDLFPNGASNIIKTTRFMLTELMASFTGLIIGVYLVVKFIEKKPFRSIGLIGEKKFKRYLRGFFFGVFFMAIISLVYYIFGYATFDKSKNGVVGITAMPTVFIVLIGWIVQGATEEILVRGWLMTRIGVRYNFVVASVVSSLVFMGLHGANNGTSILAFINLFLFGMFACFYAVYEQSIIGVCAFHSAWNWAQGNVFGFLVSGMNAEGGSLLRIMPQGNDLITGAKFGAEGSLVVTCIYTIGILFLYKFIKSKDFYKSSDYVKCSYKS